MAAETGTVWDWDKVPKYRDLMFTHEIKVLWALKIATIEPTDNQGAELTPTDVEFPPFCVSPEYVDRHEPDPGGYYIVYKGGEESFCPVESFDTFYTPI